MSQSATLPLIDLHRHLDGNIRPLSIWELAQENNIQLPVSQFQQFIPLVQIQNSEANLIDFLKKLDWGVNVLSSLDNCKRIAFENVEDVFNAGINYAELRFSPFYMAQAHNLPISDVVAAVIDGIKQGVAKYPVKINLIGILSRTFGVENCQIELNALLDHKQHLVAVDLAGDEYNFPGNLFVDHFKQVDNAGLQVTVHAGEAAGSSSIWQAINELKATRIGHGVACVSDQNLMDYMATNQIAIESCLTSNFQTGTIANLAEHPIQTFLANDILVCLNTDDPAVENTELQAEFDIARDIVKLSEPQIQQLKLNALAASFLSTNEKKALLESVK
ncbi:adenosine deaminase [Thalassotalea profundi]|uniref:adenosine deaminase n=1 Tax=Thalassotalea profundi TaxID=2036687 RepID=A0ABQ3IIY1_9GAMM|nr:adenosine deaminase [Thalassotalea profundi]GHE82426.1 adenosine deaminase [Thalassotalea profundi]